MTKTKWTTEVSAFEEEAGGESLTISESPQISLLLLFPSESYPLIFPGISLPPNWFLYLQFCLPPSNPFSRDFPGSPVAKTLLFQCREPGFDPCSGNYIPHAVTKSSHATTKDPACHS